MAEMVTLVFVVCVFGLIMAFYLGDRSMVKVIGIVTVIALFTAFSFWLSVTLFVLAWNLSVAAYFGLAALTFWKGFGFIWVGGMMCKGESIVQSVINIRKKK